MRRPGEYRPLLLVAFLAIVWIAMWVAGGAASAVDLALLHALRIPSLVGAARVLTWFGEWNALFLAVGAAALILFFRGHYRRVLLMLGLAASERLLVEIQKAAIGRARPDLSGQLVVVHNLSFPSGHAANAMAGALGIALIAFTDPMRRKFAVAAALIFAFIVGMTRPILGVHFPSDVIGGWAFGAAWALLLSRLASETPDRRRH